jgi:type VI secretion system (T6SS) effector TldE1-like protein
VDDLLTALLQQRQRAMTVGYLCFDDRRGPGRAKISWRTMVLRSMIAAVAASAVAIASIPARTPADSNAESLSEGQIEAFYKDGGEDRGAASSRVPDLRLASADVGLAEDLALAANAARTMGPAPVPDAASFSARFSSSFGERSSSFDERFGASREGDAEPNARTLLRPGNVETTDAGRENVVRPEAKRRVASLGPVSTEAAAPASVASLPNKSLRPSDVRPSSPPPDLRNRTAVYDISARVVYLPNGEKLEAHSGLGEHMDDLRSVGVKNRGVTPPNVYDLSLREQLFHGVRAIRLTPTDRDKMFGRDGILAHSYMLGPNGQSNGCVSINDYPKFLNAFLNGDIERLVVVERLTDPLPANTGVGWFSDRLKALFKLS